MKLTFNAALIPIAALLMRTASASQMGVTEHQIECPAELPASALHPAEAPSGWVSSLRGGLRLHAVDLSFGPPSEMAFLKPDFVRAQGKIGIDKWVDLNVARGVGGLWIACNYGDSDNVILGRRLDERVSECTATYSRDAQRGSVIAIRCKW